MVDLQAESPNLLEVHFKTLNDWAADLDSHCDPKMDQAEGEIELPTLVIKLCPQTMISVSPQKTICAEHRKSAAI